MTPSVDNVETFRALSHRRYSGRTRAWLSSRSALCMILVLAVVSACGDDDEPDEQAVAGKGGDANASGTSSGGAGGQSGGGQSGGGQSGGGLAGMAPGAAGAAPSAEAGGGGEANAQAGETSANGGQKPSGGEGGQAGAGPTSVAVEVTPEAGGTVTLGDTVVDVPAGAVSQPVTITLEQVDLTTLAPLPAGAHAIGPAVALLPHGLTFSVPVSITLSHSGGSGGERAVVRLDDEADLSWSEVASPAFTASDVTFETSTFSIVVPVERAAPGDVIHLHRPVSDDGNIDHTQAVVFDHQDHLLVGSRISVAGELGDAIVIKLGPDTELQGVDRRVNWVQEWEHRVTSAPAASNQNRDDSVLALAVDQNDNVLVAGNTSGVLVAPYNNAGAFDAYVRKLDSAGNELWTRQWGGVMTDNYKNSQNDSAVAVAVDGSNNVLVTGTLDFRGSIWIGDAYVRKLDPNGELMWEYVVTAESPAHDYGIAIAVDASNDVLMLGGTEGDVKKANAGKADYFVTKLDGLTGKEQWTKQYGTAEIDCANALALDAAGNVFVAGQTGTCSDGAYPGLAAFVVKLTPSGDFEWQHDVITPGGEQRARALTLDPQGNLLVAGYSTGSFDSSNNVNAGSSDVFVRKLLPNKTPVWTNLFGNSKIQYTYDVAVDSTGLVAVVGTTQGALDAAAPSTSFEPFIAWLLP